MAKSVAESEKSAVLSVESAALFLSFPSIPTAFAAAFLAEGHGCPLLSVVAVWVLWQINVVKCYNMKNRGNKT